MKAGTGFEASIIERAAGTAAVKLHAAERGVHYAVAEDEAERARADVEMADAGLADIEIDVGIEGGGGRGARGERAPAACGADSLSPVPDLPPAAERRDLLLPRARESP